MRPRLGIRDADTGTNVRRLGARDQRQHQHQRRPTELSAALTTLRAQASTLGANLSVVTNRQDFTAT